MQSGGKGMLEYSGLKGNLEKEFVGISSPIPMPRCPLSGLKIRKSQIIYLSGYSLGNLEGELGGRVQDYLSLRLGQCVGFFELELAFYALFVRSLSLLCLLAISLG